MAKKYEVDIKLESAINNISNAIKYLKEATDERTDGYKQTSEFSIDIMLPVIIELMIIKRKLARL